MIQQLEPEKFHIVTPLRHEYLRCTHCGRGQFVVTAAIAPVPQRLLNPRGPP